ncbi:MAG: hypothetical protein JRH15_15115 [Deltaproteobacteria bacterium]|nr:hypothetical protein [Deltaproteobacteria bacterium]
MDKENTYENDYLPFIIKRGRIFLLSAVVLSFLPVLVLSFVYGLTPGFSNILAAFISMASFVGIFWVIEPFLYFPIVGVPGIYLCFLSGNTLNLRLPCAAAAQKAAGVEPGTDKGTLIATLGISVSVLVNIVLLSSGVIFGSVLLSILSPEVRDALGYILPALFGAVFGQFAVKNPKIGVIGLGIGLIMETLMRHGYLSFLPGVPSYAVILVTVLGTIGISVKLIKKVSM